MIKSTVARGNVLPDGWRWARLGDVSSMIETRDPRREPGNTFKYVDITSVDNVDKRIVEAREIIGKDAPSRARQVIRAGDVIVSTTRPNLNAIALVPIELENQICSTGFCVLRPTDELGSPFLFAFVQTPEFVNGLSESVKGALYPAVTDAQVRAAKIPLPPLAEQKRIAARLNEIMEQVALARAAARTALDAASKLDAALLNEAFTNEETRNWLNVKIGVVCKRRTEIVHPNDGTKGKLRFVGLEHIESHTGRRIVETLLDAEALDGRKPRFYEGDVVYGYLRPYLNKVWIAEFDGVSSVDQYAFAVNPGLADAKFLAYYLRSPIYLYRAPIDVTPGFLPRIRSEEVEGTLMPLPSVDEQKEVVARLDRRIRAANQARIATQAQLDALNALPAVYLRRAFRGEL